jgi:hypothetical protein
MSLLILNPTDLAETRTQIRPENITISDFKGSHQMFDAASHVFYINEFGEVHILKHRYTIYLNGKSIL